MAFGGGCRPWGCFGEGVDRSCLPWWAHDTVVECLGCPASCHVLSTASRMWKEATRRTKLVHNKYRCSMSGRRVSLLLPDGMQLPAAGVTPAAYSGLWRRRSRELDIAPSILSCECSDRLLVGPVLCPHPGCDHEEPSAELAVLHSASCPVGASHAARGCRGFCYALPGEVAAALRRRALRETAELILDFDLGGCSRSVPMKCLCEIDDETPGLTFRDLDDSRGSVKVHLDKCTGIHRGWQLDLQAQCAFERGAFPRTVDLVVFSGCYDSTCDYYTSRLSGWAFCPCASRRLLSGDAWSRTLVITLEAAPGSEKQRRAGRFLQSHSQGCYDKLSVYVLGLIGDSSFLDAEFPAAGDMWRIALQNQLQAVGASLSVERRREVEHLLAASCPAVRVEDIAAEYSECTTDFLFVTLASEEAAERFCRTLQAVIPHRTLGGHNLLSASSNGRSSSKAC